MAAAAYVGDGLTRLCVLVLMKQARSTADRHLSSSAMAWYLSSRALSLPSTPRSSTQPPRLFVCAEAVAVLGPR
jgi:hypothetical protein